MSAHHRAQRWTTHAPKLKATLAAMLPLPCVECRQAVTADMAWQVGHRTPAALGGRPTLDNVGAVHTSCNRKAGGKLGATITNARRTASRRAEQDIRPW